MLDFIYIYLIIAINQWLPAQFTQILDNVIDKGVVVINDYYHIYLILIDLVLRVSTSALALSSVSWYSFSGSES